MTHDLQHQGLAEMQATIDRIWQAQYANAKKHNAHAPRKFATRATHSQRVSQVAKWRAHLTSHGVTNLPPFVSLAEIQALHDQLHAEGSAR